MTQITLGEVSILKRRFYQKSSRVFLRDSTRIIDFHEEMVVLEVIVSG
jgi:hypothetical protein